MLGSLPLTSNPAILFPAAHASSSVILFFIPSLWPSTLSPEEMPHPFQNIFLLGMPYHCRSSIHITKLHQKFDSTKTTHDLLHGLPQCATNTTAFSIQPTWGKLFSSCQPLLLSYSHRALHAKERMHIPVSIIMDLMRRQTSNDPIMGLDIKSCT